MTIFTAFFLYFSLYAQKITVTGVVTSADDNSPLPGVNVIISGTLIGTVTNIDGKYTINVPSPESRLEFSFIGFNKEIITVNDKTQINVVLKSSTDELEEVVVVGFGVQKRETLVGSIATTNSEEIKKSSVDNIASALVGRLNGLTGLQTSAQPGSSRPDLQIRGRSGILVIVDGVETSGGQRLSTQSSGDSWNTTSSISGWESINPNDIESISMLKDASATAVYGVRGANGVLIITTKKGTSGKPVVSYSGNVSLSTPLSQLRMVGSYDMLSVLNQANAVDGQGLYLFKYDDWQRFKYPEAESDKIKFPSVDPIEAYTREFSPKTDHVVSLRGGGEFVKYYASLGYYDEKGLLKEIPQLGSDFNYGYKRLTLRTNLDFSLTKRISFLVNLDTRLENRGGPSITGADTHFDFVYYARPWLTPGYIDDKFVKNIIPNDRSQSSILEYYLSGGFYSYDQVTSSNKFTLKYDLDFITKGLSAKTMYALDNYTVSGTKRSRRYSVWEIKVDPETGDAYYTRAFDGSGQKVEDGPYNQFSPTTGRYRKDYFEASLNYSNTFLKKHNVTALALYNFEKNYYGYDGGYPDIPRSYQGFVGRITYDYDRKYLAEFNIGINGSENFAPDKRYGKFPAFSLGWVPTEENFMKNNVSFINFLKFRGSYGKVGEDRSSARFLYLPTTYQIVGATWDSYYYRLFTTDNRASYINALREGNGYNPNVTWETSVKYNLGIEGDLFKSRLNFSIDLFKEERTGILTSMQGVPNSIYPTDLLAGFYHNNYLAMANYNEQRSHGYEFELGWVENKKEISYSISFNYAFAQVINTVVSQTSVNYPWQVEAGFMNNNAFGFLADGLWESYEEINDPRNPRVPNMKNPVPGDVKYKDINGDGIITDHDAVPLKYPVSNPLKSFGSNFSFMYKNIELTGLVQGASMVYYQNGASTMIMDYEGNGPMFSWHLEDRWTPQDPGDKMNPVYHTSNTNSYNYTPSTFWIYDGSYVRLKNIQLAYNLPKKVLGNFMSEFQIYLSGQNLFTYYADYRFRDGLDPERFEGYYPLMSIYTLGVNVTF